jgi:hypothetical protein
LVFYQKLFFILVFAVDDNRGADFSPGKDLSDIGGFHIDATVRHGNTKIVVPISAMKTVTHAFTNFIVVEKHNVGDIG